MGVAEGAAALGWEAEVVVQAVAASRA